MRIGINATGLDTGYRGFDAAYIRNVVRAFKTNEGRVTPVFIADDNNQDSFGNDTVVSIGQARPWKSSDADFRRALDEANVDVLLSPMLRLPDNASVPVAALAGTLRPWAERNLNQRWYRRDQLKKISRQAQEAAIAIVPSVFLQRQLLEFVEIGLDKITVAPVGVDEAFAEDYASVVEPPYILYVGTTDTERNIDMLLQVLEQMRPNVSDHLIIVGAPGSAERERWGDHILRFDHVPARNLTALYQHAQLTVCPSPYDGSGITVLEALRAGGRVAAGRVGGIPEVAADYPLYYNTNDQQALAAVIRRALSENPAERKAHIRLGRHHAAAFTWDKCAWKVLAALRRIATSRKA